MIEIYTHSLQLTAPQSVVSTNTSPTDDHLNKSIHTTSSAVFPVPLPNSHLSTALVSLGISLYRKLQLSTGAPLFFLHKRLSIHFAERVGSDMSLAVSIVAYCVSGPTWVLGLSAASPRCVQGLQRTPKCFRGTKCCWQALGANIDCIE